MNILFLAAALLANPVMAQMHPSATMALLEKEAAKNPAGAHRLETVKATASEAFNGEDASRQAETNVPDGGLHYIMEGSSPMKGVVVYIPKLDPNGNGKTEKPEYGGIIPAKIIKYTKIGMGVGAGAIIGGALLGGLFGAILLFLGGALLGAGAAILFINKKSKGKKD